MLLSLLSGITQHTTITLNLFSKKSIIIDNYRYFVPKNFLCWAFLLYSLAMVPPILEYCI